MDATTSGSFGPRILQLLDGVPAGDVTDTASVSVNASAADRRDTPTAEADQASVLDTQLLREGWQRSLVADLLGIGSWVGGDIGSTQPRKICGEAV
jgi:hypothetical protein